MQNRGILHILMIMNVYKYIRIIIMSFEDTTISKKERLGWKCDAIPIEKHSSKLMSQR